MREDTVRRTKKQRKIIGKIKEEDFASTLSYIQNDSLIEIDKLQTFWKLEWYKHI